MGKVMVTLVGLMMATAMPGQMYRPVEIKPSVGGSYRYLTPEDLWQVVFEGVAVQRSLLFRLEVYLYDGETGQLLYRGSSFALKQAEAVWEVDFNVLSGFGAIRQEGVSPAWWSEVQQNGGYLPAGRYKVEYVAVETDEKCLWTGIELARQQAYFEIVSDYVVEPVFPAQGDTVCGFPHFVWDIVGAGSAPYELLVYYGRMGWSDVVGVTPLARFAGIRDNQYSGMGNISLQQEGWYTYVVRGSDGVVSKPVWFYFIPSCSEEEEQIDNERVVPAGWWHQLDYTSETQVIRSRSDTIYLEWLQNCSEQAQFNVLSAKDMTVLSYEVSGSWHRLIALIPEGQEFKVGVRVCDVKTRQTWKIIKQK